VTRPISKVAPGWWNYTTLDTQLLADAAALKASDLEQLSRPGFTVKIYDTLEALYCSQALEVFEKPPPLTIFRPLRFQLGSVLNHFTLDCRSHLFRFYREDQG